ILAQERQEIGGKTHGTSRVKADWVSQIRSIPSSPRKRGPRSRRTSLALGSRFRGNDDEICTPSRHVPGPSCAADFREATRACPCRERWGLAGRGKSREDRAGAPT